MKYKKKTLKNGVRVLIIPMPESPTVTYMAWVNTGSHYEEKKENGISHFLEHMVFKGTENRTIRDIRREIDGIGAYNNAFTGEEYTAYYAKSHPKNLKKIIGVISDMYLKPLIPKEDLEKERGVILGEIDMYEDNPMSLVHKIWEQLVYGDQPAGRTILGPKENIKRFKREDFIKYKEKHYVAESTVAVIAGKFDERKALIEIEKQFKNISTNKRAKKVKVKDSQKKQEIVIRNKKTDQSHLVLGFRALNLFDKSQDLAVLEVLNTILGRSMSSRLFVRVREELGLGYYVRSHAESLTDHGYLTIDAGVDNKRVSEAVNAILNEVKKLKKELVPKDELEAAKRYFIGIFPMSLEQSDSVAVNYAYSEIRGKSPVNPSDVYKEIERVTAGQIKKMAERIFRNNKMNLAVVGPHKDKKALSKILKV
jgi:predicted Zn-dependent peptidase